MKDKVTSRKVREPSNAGVPEGEQKYQFLDKGTLVQAMQESDLRPQSL